MARRRKIDEALDDAREHLNGADEDPGPPPVNSAARAQIIREACEEIGEFDRQIDGLKAEKKAVIETRIVAGLGMKKAHFATAYKLHQMDQSDRDVLQDTIRETFAALGIGMQSNWLDAVDGVSAATPG